MSVFSGATLDLSESRTYDRALEILGAYKLTGNFPDYERVLPKEHPLSVTLEREELCGAFVDIAHAATCSARVGPDDPRPPPPRS